MALTGKVAIVTGSNRGIGRAIAERFHREGARIVLTGRDRAALDETQRALGDRCSAVALDLREPPAASELVAHAVAHHGAIDIIVNNAGATRRGPFTELSDDDWTDGFALKLFAAARLARLSWPYLVARQGSVINIAGIGGRTPGAEFAVGGAVNAALLSFTKALAETGLAAGVQVNAINPGSVRTARFARRLAGRPEADFVRSERITRVGEPADIAALAAFLAGPEGRWIHGSLIDVDGGATKTL